MFPIVCLYAAGIDRREISELKTIGRHRVVRITFQTYDCCVESFVVKQGALFYEKARNVFMLTGVKLLLYVLWKQIVIQFTPNGLINEIKTEGYRI